MPSSGLRRTLLVTAGGFFCDKEPCHVGHCDLWDLVPPAEHESYHRQRVMGRNVSDLNGRNVLGCMGPFWKVY